MKKPVRLGKFGLFFAAILLLTISAFTQEGQPFSTNTSPLPPSTGFVNDFAGVIDASTKQQLETKLKNLKGNDRSFRRDRRCGRKNYG